MHQYSLRFAICTLDPISELRFSRILIMLMLWLYDIFQKFLFIKQGMSIAIITCAKFFQMISILHLFIDATDFYLNYN